MLQSKVAIVDDHPIVIQGLKNLLESEQDFEVKGCFNTGGEFISYLRENPVDIVLLDVNLPDGSGIQFCREIKLKYPGIQVLAISNLSQRSIVQQMLHAGASGYLMKTAEPGDILACMAEIAAGNIAFCKTVKEMMDRPELGELTEIPELTKREKQILRLLAEGYSSMEISKELFISPLTVKTHRATLLQKFKVSNVVNLVNLAREYHLL